MGGCTILRSIFFPDVSIANRNHPLLLIGGAVLAFLTTCVWLAQSFWAARWSEAALTVVRLAVTQAKNKEVLEEGGIRQFWRRHENLHRTEREAQA